MRDHWTPTIVQAGALFITIFQLVYLLVDFPTASREALCLHALNIGIALSGFGTSFLVFGRTHGRMITFWGLVALMVSMTWLCVLTANNDWFYVSLGLLTMGASALMPWEIAWQTSLNLVALLTAAVQGYFVPDSSSVLTGCWSRSQSASRKPPARSGSAIAVKSKRPASTPSRLPKPSRNFFPACRTRSAPR